MEKKYQVFISSTYDDLKEERKKALEILLMADCIPAGMEAFVATDAGQFEVIKKVIDLCDYYVLIIGKRYGSVNPDTGISYTEMEYDYAISKDIPVLVFPLDNSVDVPSDKIDNDEYNLFKLKSFRAKAMNNRMVSIWRSIDDLAGKLAISIMKAKSEINRPGWQRGSDYDEVSLRRKAMDLQTENQKLLEEREKKREKEEAEKRKYKEYEGIWIQYIPRFSRAYAVCELKYKDGRYYFNGFNYFVNETAPIRFDSQVFSSHMTEISSESFYFITDAHQTGHLVQRINGFGEVSFLDSNQTGAHDGEGYFYDVASAKGETDDEALQEFIMVKHDKYLYERLGISKTPEEIKSMDFEAILAIANEYKNACFFLKDKEDMKLY